ncbi:MAG: OmpA family protein [Pseudomonadota bacterium]
MAGLLRQWLRRVLPGLMLGAGMTTAGAEPYSEPLERSDWKVGEDNAICLLEQEVRHGGHFRFESRPGVVTSAVWQAPYPMPDLEMPPRLRTGAPEWLRPATLDPLDLRLQARGTREFYVPPAQVQALRARLQAGHDLRIDFPDDEGAVHFRGIRFARRMGEFNACHASHGRPAGGPDSGALGRWSIHFETASDRLDGEARATLDALLEALRGSPGARLRVVGWTDAQGPLEINRRLSRARAAAVRDALMDLGIPEGRIELEAPGVDPVADGERAASRRTDIWWVDAGAPEPSAAPGREAGSPGNPESGHPAW